MFLVNVFHCADCVDNRIINDILCVKRKELGDGISKWVSHLNNNLDRLSACSGLGITPFLNPSSFVGFSVEFFHGCYPITRPSRSVCIEL